METKVVTIDKLNMDMEEINLAGKVLQSGGLVAFPTETVYGLGGDALNPEASKKIYAAKGRPSDNPLIIHIAKWEDLERIVSYIPLEAKKLADKYWPGPLTLVLQKSDKVPYETTGGLETVAVRMPDDKIALALIEAAGGYVAAPSANTSGKPSPTLAKYVKEDLDGKIDIILDGGAVGIGLESTIVDLTSSTPEILRPGFVTKEMLKEVLGEVEVDAAILSSSSKQAPKAPGMKYKHYAPNGELTIVSGGEKEVIKYINEQTREGIDKGHLVGVICTDATKKLYTAKKVKSAGKREDEQSIARGLYRILREFDDEGVDIIFSEDFESDGMGKAIMNRLLKAAGHRVKFV